MKKLAIVIIVSVFLITLLAAQDQKQDQKYVNNSFARLSYISGSSYIQRSADLGYEEGVINMPVAEGDRLGTAKGRIEVFLGNRNYIRLDENTKVDFLNLPKKDDNLIRINVWAGSVYLDVNKLENEKDIELHTQDASFYILSEGLYRLDAKENREFEILIFQGMLEAAGAEGSVMLKSQQRLEIKDGRFTSKPSQFYAVAEDDFDRWSNFRDSQMGRTTARKRYLPQNLQDFEEELDQYGEWVYVAPYGNVWIPRGQDEDWRPYSYGRWTWMAMSGWTWLGYEPWGWAPYHYGRWGWGPGMGWYWMPGSVWGPGWVNWWWDDYYFGWAPMGWYGYPIAIVGNRYYDRWDGEYPHNSRAMTVIHKDQLKAKNMAEVALSRDSLANAGKIHLSSAAPALRPSTVSLRVQEIDGKKVMLRNEDRSINLAPDTRSEKSAAPARTDEQRLLKSPDAEGRKIRIRDDAPLSKATSPSGNLKTPVHKNSFGYPSSPSITKSLSGESGRKSSFIDRLHRYIQGGSSSSGSSSSRGTIRSSGSSSSGSSSSRGTIRSSGSSTSSSSSSRSSGSSSSRGSSSGSSSSHGSSGGSGSIRKK